MTLTTPEFTILDDALTFHDDVFAHALFLNSPTAGEPAPKPMKMPRGQDCAGSRSRNT